MGVMITPLHIARQTASGVVITPLHTARQTVTGVVITPLHTTRQTATGVVTKPQRRGYHTIAYSSSNRCGRWMTYDGVGRGFHSEPLIESPTSDKLRSDIFIVSRSRMQRKR